MGERHLSSVPEPAAGFCGIDKPGFCDRCRMDHERIQACPWYRKSSEGIAKARATLKRESVTAPITPPDSVVGSEP